MGVSRLSLVRARVGMQPGAILGGEESIEILCRRDHVNLRGVLEVTHAEKGKRVGEALGPFQRSLPGKKDRLKL